MVSFPCQTGGRGGDGGRGGTGGSGGHISSTFKDQDMDLVMLYLPPNYEGGQGGMGSSQKEKAKKMVYVIVS